MSTFQRLQITMNKGVTRIMITATPLNILTMMVVIIVTMPSIIQGNKINMVLVEIMMNMVNLPGSMLTIV